jgi:hypothetical protein
VFSRRQGSTQKTNEGVKFNKPDVSYFRRSPTTRAVVDTDSYGAICVVVSGKPLAFDFDDEVDLSGID